MSHITTADELLAKMGAMPATERNRFFALLGSRFFPDDNLTHAQVFGHLTDEAFTAQEAAEYLEISITTLRRYIRKGRLTPSLRVGRRQLFSTQDLKALKQSLRKVTT